jgi:hypothetical protein
MYLRKGMFGRTREAFLSSPVDATTRSVAQIDLVLTLSLLLGIPIPFNNLDAPIEGAFVGRDGTFLENLARVSRLAALGMERYQSAYSSSTGRDLNTSTAAAQKLWELQSSNSSKPVLGGYMELWLCICCTTGQSNLGTTPWAGLLRRHLMLYRVFCPRFMMGAVDCW